MITRQGDCIAIVTGYARHLLSGYGFHGVPAIDLGKMVVGEMLRAATFLPKSSSNWSCARRCRCRKRDIARKLCWVPA